MQFACYRKQKIKKFINPNPGNSKTPRRPLTTLSAQPPTSQHRRIQNPIGSALHIPNTAKYRNPHRLSLPHPNTAEYRTLSAQPFTSPTPPNTEIHIGTTSHIPTPQNTTTSQQPPVTTTKHSFKKSPRGVQRGRGFTAPLRFSFSQKEYIV